MASTTNATPLHDGRVLFLRPANLLIMDEPTNDLDIETLELLEEQLLAYKGTLLLVSHDREFLDNVVTSTMVLEGDGLVRQYPGGYADYERQRQLPQKNEAAAKPAPRSSAAGGTENECAKKKLTYNEQRELSLLPAKIEKLEAELEEMRSALSDPEIYRRDPSRAQKLAADMPQREAELDAAMERWAELEDRAG